MINTKYLVHIFLNDILYRLLFFYHLYKYQYLRSHHIHYYLELPIHNL